ncbi:hypothetical protein [Shewanella algae]|uniref:hypothetical protein n=1 Tax=Shewanella algae TaxID=38313 RepID=UPI0031F53418
MAIAYYDPKPRAPFRNSKKAAESSCTFPFSVGGRDEQSLDPCGSQALLDFAEFEALMASTSELIFYTVLLTFWAKCWKFADKFARYFCNILENSIKFIMLKNTAGR